MKTRLLLLALFLLQVTGLLAQSAPRPKLTPRQAEELSALMCRQLPNIGTMLENKVEIAPTAPAAPPQEPMVTDDVYDALLQLGPYSLQCLTDKLLDDRWMPDPRSEPLLGSPVVGDVAYMVLGDKGVPDFLPQLTHKKPDELRMDDYFDWPSIADHRQLLQSAVRKWLAEHPDCCGAVPLVRSTEPELKFRLSDFDSHAAKSRLSRLHLGMSPDEVLKIAGKPDAIDRDADSPDHWHTALLGFCTKDHNENMAYIYFFERWADEVARRDPLRDRYVIVFFSAKGKLTRMFSNLADAEWLMEVMEAELDLPPAFKIDFARSPKARRAWEARDPHYRRATLLQIFSRPGPVSRAKAVPALIAELELSAEREAGGAPNSQ